MQAPVGQHIPLQKDAQVRLLKNTRGAKKINNQWVDHTLPEGTIVTIIEVKPSNTRTSISTDPLLGEDYLYKLETVLVEIIPQEAKEGPYAAINDVNKIRHTALDTSRCLPSRSDGMYNTGQRPCILPGNHRFNYGKETLVGGDTIEIMLDATTKSGGKNPKIAANAYYPCVYKIRRFEAPARITWRAMRFATGLEVEVVHHV